MAMKLIYVKVPVIEEILRAYVVSDEDDLNGKFLTDQAAFEKAAKWYAKPNKTKDGKNLDFRQINKDGSNYQTHGH